jgi:hypothetical protein
MASNKPWPWSHCRPRVGCSTTAEVLSNVVRSTQKGPFTSTDGKLRKFTHGAEVDLKFLVKKNKDRIVAKGESDVRGQPPRDAVLGCVFHHGLPTKELSAGKGGCMREGCWFYGPGSKAAKTSTATRNKGGCGKTPHAVRNCGGPAGVVNSGVVHQRRPDGSSAGAKQAGSDSDLWPMGRTGPVRRRGGEVKGGETRAKTNS